MKRVRPPGTPHFVFVIPLFLAACAGPPTTHTATLAPRATSSLEQMESLLDSPGPIQFTHHRAADWEVPLSGLLNLEAEKSKAAGLKDRDEPIFIDFFELRHPEQGTFLVDSGVRENFQSWAQEEIPWLARWALNLGALKQHSSTASWLSQHEAPEGVFLTHLHLDHILGLQDLPAATPIYTGPRETSHESFKASLAQDLTDKLLTGKTEIRELRATAEQPAIDLLGDASVWAIYAPGHTAGSLAYVARTTEGPVLMTGDVCHTSFGFEHGVEPGSFTEDPAANRRSLAMLRNLAKRHPQMRIYLGHQDAPR